MFAWMTCFRLFASKTSRRAFPSRLPPQWPGLLKGGVAMTAGAAAARKEPDPLITELQDWASYTGEGVDETPYGMPIELRRAMWSAATWNG